MGECGLNNNIRGVIVGTKVGIRRGETRGVNRTSIIQSITLLRRQV